MPVIIKDVQTILTQPAGSRLVIVKVITSEPGLYGLGCATFTQRFHAVYTAIEKHLKPFVLGRRVSCIEEVFRMAAVHSYWRNGPVLNNAISGIDMALWDIKGKQAGMPVYQLLGANVEKRRQFMCTPMGKIRKKSKKTCANSWSKAIATFECKWAGMVVRPTNWSNRRRPDGAYFTPAPIVAICSIWSSTYARQ